MFGMLAGYLGTFRGLANNLGKMGKSQMSQDKTVSREYGYLEEAGLDIEISALFEIF